MSETSAELILIDGEPDLSLIPDTNVLWATNTESDLFLSSYDGRYYYLMRVRRRRGRSVIRTSLWIVSTVVLAAVVIFEMVGPLSTRFALIRSGEAGHSRFPRNPGGLVVHDRSLELDELELQVRRDVTVGDEPSWRLSVHGRV